MPGHFAGTFPDIYICWPNVHSCNLRSFGSPVFWCEFVSASAYAKRLLCGPNFVSKLACPLCCILLVDTSILHQFLWSYNNSQHRCNIGRKIVSQRCDKREARRPTDRSKTRAPAESTTSPPTHCPYDSQQLPFVSTIMTFGKV